MRLPTRGLNSFGCDRSLERQRNIGRLDYPTIVEMNWIVQYPNRRVSALHRPLSQPPALVPLGRKIRQDRNSDSGPSQRSWLVLDHRPQSPKYLAAAPAEPPV